MEQEYEDLGNEILKLTTRDEAICFCREKNDMINKLAEEHCEFTNKVLTHLCIILTPEDYDDDICD